VSKKKSPRKEEVAAIVKEAEKAEVQEKKESPEVVENKKAESKEVETAVETPGPKLVGKRKGRAPISPEGALIRVLTFLPRSLVEKIHDTGRPMSRYIRELVEEKLGE
jgi:hypothetical protein